jgi:hypothetical protein
VAIVLKTGSLNFLEPSGPVIVLLYYGRSEEESSQWRNSTTGYKVYLELMNRFMKNGSKP